MKNGAFKMFFLRLKTCPVFLCAKTEKPGKP